MLAPFRQGSQGWLSVSEGLPRDFAVICFTGAQIAVGKGVALSPGETDAARRLPHQGSARTWLGGCRERDPGLGPLCGRTGC